MLTNVLRLAVVCLCFSLSARAQAQTMGRTVVLTHALEAGGEVAAQAAAPIENALISRHVSVVSLHEARDRFIAHSRAPLPALDTDVDVLAREARNAIEHVAFGRSAAAQRSVKEVLTRAERALETLNRETSTARQVLDACLALVRASLQKDDRREAVTQAMACRRLVPDVAPNENLHPASVIGVLAEADDQLRRMRIGRLVVSSAPESSCSVYLNGRHLGTTPFLLDRAAAGLYRVQVECNEARGRVHVVELGNEPVDLAVDVNFDAAIVSDPRLTLRYRARTQENAEVVHHGELLGRAVRADDVILVGVDGNRVELARVNVRQGRLTGLVHVPWSAEKGYEGESLSSALESLAEGRIERELPPVLKPAQALTAQNLVGIRSTDVALASMPSASNDAAPVRGPLRLKRVGWSLVGVGVAAMAVGLGFELRAHQLDNQLTALPENSQAAEDKQHAYDRARALRWTGIAGGALGVAAVPMLVKPRPSVPWWSWALGGVGLGVAAVGAWQVAIADHCTLPTSHGVCAQRKATEGRGALLLSTSAALLTVPISQLFLRERPSLSVNAGRNHAGLALRFQL